MIYYSINLFGFIKNNKLFLFVLCDSRRQTVKYIILYIFVAVSMRKYFFSKKVCVKFFIFLINITSFYPIRLPHIVTSRTTYVCRRTEYVYNTCSGYISRILPFQRWSKRETKLKKKPYSIMLLLFLR